MSKCAFALIVLLLGGTLAPGSADAQGIFRFGVGGGLTMPQSELGDFTDQGYHGQVMVGVNIPFFPIAARLDAAYHELPTGNDANVRQLAFTANARVASIGLPVTPYLIAGFGLYNTRLSEGASSGELDLGTQARTDFGVNGGAGILLRLGIVHAFAEARYHHVFVDDARLSHIPVTVGIMF